MKPPVVLKAITENGKISHFEFTLGGQSVIHFNVLDDKPFEFDLNSRIIKFDNCKYNFTRMITHSKIEFSVSLSNKMASLLMMRFMVDCEYESHIDDKNQIQIFKDFLNSIY